MAIVTVGKDGKAPKGLKAGDKVVTAGGTYTIQQVNKDGSYKSTKWETGGTRPASTPSGGSSTSKAAKTTTTTQPSYSAAQMSAAEKTIAAAKEAYARAYATGDYAGMRAANDAANAARASVGIAAYSSAAGDAQRAATMGQAAANPAAAPKPIEQPIPQLAPQPQNVLNTANSVLDRYTLDQLIALFGPGVEASYNTLENEAKRTLGAFDQGIFQIGNNNIEAVKRMHGTAATGQASQAAAGAQALSALMNTFMDAAPVFTGMNQEMQGLSAKKAEAMANLVPTAMQAKNTQDSNFANLFNSLYAADTQFGVGALDYLGNKYNADKNLEGNKYASDKNLEGTIQQALANIKASQNYGGGSSGGSTYNPNATYEGYVTKAYDALANGNRGDFFFYMTQVGVEPKEAQDLFTIWTKEQAEKLKEEQGDGGGGGKKPPQSAVDYFRKLALKKNIPYNSGVNQ